METKHTPEIWHKVKAPLGLIVGKREGCDIREGNETGQLVCHIPEGPHCDKYADKILRACNAHEELMEALQQIFEHAYDDDTPTDQICADFDDMREIARAALKKAEEV